jgi:hypothetical protein
MKQRVVRKFGNGRGAHKEVKQEKQCTYIVKMRRVRATIVAVEKQKLLHILSVGL